MPPNDEILNALAAPHANLYMASAEFKAQLKALASMLPTMVDGLAAVATRELEQRQVMMRKAMMEGTPWRP